MDYGRQRQSEGISGATQWNKIIFGLCACASVHNWLMRAHSKGVMKQHIADKQFDPHCASLRAEAITRPRVQQFEDSEEAERERCTRESTWWLYRTRWNCMPTSSTNLWTVESCSGASPGHPAGFFQQGPSSSATQCPRGWCDVFRQAHTERR